MKRRDFFGVIASACVARGSGGAAMLSPEKVAALVWSVKASEAEHLVWVTGLVTGPPQKSLAYVRVGE